MVSQGNVEVADGIVVERIITNRRVGVGGGAIAERGPPERGVVFARGIIFQCEDAEGCVIVTGGIVRSAP